MAGNDMDESDLDNSEFRRKCEQDAAQKLIKKSEGKIVTVWVTSNKKNSGKILKVYLDKSDAEDAINGDDDLLVNHEQALLYPDSTVYILKNTKRIKVL